jgi:hypothetical protein
MELEIGENFWSPTLNKPINRELHTRVVSLRDTFSDILDSHGTELEGTLRVKMAKAELVLNRIGLLIEKELEERKTEVP